MDPFGGNQQIAINRPGCSSGWRIVAASPVFVDVTLWPEGSSALPQDTVPRPKWTLGLWRTTFLALRHSYFWQKWKSTSENTGHRTPDTVHRTPYTRHRTPEYTGSTPEKYPGLHPPLLAGWGGGNDELAIDKGGNLPEKVENHWCRRYDFNENWWKYVKNKKFKLKHSEKNVLSNCA